MSTPVQLIPLRCTQCEFPVPAGHDEIAWECAQCGQGLLLDEEQGLLPYSIQYSDILKAGQVGRPFWMVKGKVSMRRETYSSGFLNRDKQAAQDFWSQDRVFFIPAYKCSVDEMVNTGVFLLRGTLTVNPGSAADFEPILLKQEDIQVYAEYLVMAIEAERSDKVKQVSFSLALQEPELWILPPAR